LIRDPSDGSVKEPQKPAPVSTAAQNSAEGEPAVTPVHAGAGPILDTTTSGLPTGSSKQSEIDRLNKWRKWLHEYHANKNKPTSDPEK
jgi:hypothetical protein